MAGAGAENVLVPEILEGATVADVFIGSFFLFFWKKVVPARWIAFLGERFVNLNRTTWPFLSSRVTLFLFISVYLIFPTICPID